MTFAGIPDEFSRYETARIAVQPVPYDGTSTWGKGADKGPAAILEAAENMELYDIETDSQVYEQGIYLTAPVDEARSPEAMTDAVYRSTHQLLRDGKWVMTLGGEHSISIGAIQAHADRYPDLTVLQVDAHTDLRDSYHGSRYNHACVMARAKEVAQIVQVGIRAMDIGELDNLDRSRVLFSHEIHKDPKWIDKVMALLSNHVYLTIDLDGFDPAYVPATGTPEPGGLTWMQVMELLQAVIRKSTVVGCDVVELAANPLHHGSDFLAAKLVYRILSMAFDKTGK
jgi:agmatinase